MTDPRAPDKPLARRELLTSGARTVAGAVLAAIAVLLAARASTDRRGGECLKTIACGDCPSGSDCPLPRARAARATPKGR